MPSTFDFCLPTRSTSVPSGPDWLHEIKYDGYRLRLERDGDRVRLITKGGYNWTHGYPWIIESARCGAHLPSSPSGLVIIPDDLGPVRTRADADQFSRA